VDIGVKDWFTPYRRVWLDEEDMDLGASGPVLIPDDTPFLVGGGKQGLIYLIDRANMGGLDPAHWTKADYDKLTVDDTYETQRGQEDFNRDRVRQKFQAGQVQDLQNAPSGSPHMIGSWWEWPHIHGAPAFAQFGDSAFLYVWPEKDFLKAYRWLDRLDNYRFETTQVQNKFLLAPPVNNKPCAMPGGMISVAVDPTGPGLGVVFATVFDKDHCPNPSLGRLHAVDPETLNELWESDPYFFVKFVPPTIANNKVFLPTDGNEVLVFGLH
jgi:hypothetical protein